MGDKYIFPTESIRSKRRVFKPISQLQLNEYYILNFRNRQRQLDQTGTVSGALAISDVSLQYAQSLLYASDITDLDYAFVDEANNIYIGGRFRGTGMSGMTLPNTSSSSLVTFIAVLDAVFIPLYYLFFVPTVMGSIPPVLAGVRLLRDEVLGNRLVVAVNYQSGFTMVKYPSAVPIATVPLSSIPSFRVFYINPVTFGLVSIQHPTGVSGNVVQIGQNPAVPANVMASTTSNPATLALTATGGNTLAYSTTAGVTWVNLGNVTFEGNGTSVLWTSGLYIATGNNSSNSIASSLDGITWTGIGNTVITHGLGTGMIRLNGATTLLAFGQGANTIAYSSDNASTWVGLGDTVFTNRSYRGVFNGDIMIGTGVGSNTLAYTPNGTTWYGLGNTVFTSAAHDVAWGSDRWVGVGVGTSSIATSWNGISWVAQGTDTMVAGYGVAYGNNTYVVVGEGGNTIAYSSNANTWTGLGTSIFTIRGLSVEYDGTQFIATGQGTASVATSPNGITWTPITTPFPSATDITGRALSYTSTASGGYLPLKSYIPIDFETNGVLLPITAYPSSTFTWDGNTYTNSSLNMQNMIATLRFNGSVLRSSSLENGILYSLDTDSNLQIYVGVGTTLPITSYGMSLVPIGTSMHIYALRLNRFFQGQWSQFIITPQTVTSGNVLPVQIFVPELGRVAVMNPSNGANVRLSDGTTATTTEQQFISITRLDTDTGLFARQDLFPWSTESYYSSSIRIDPFGNGILSGIATSLSLPLPFGDTQYANSDPFVFVLSTTSSSSVTQSSSSNLSISLQTARFRNYFTVSALGYDSTYYEFYTLTTSTTPTLFNKPINGILNDGNTRTYIVTAQYGINYI